MSFDVDDPRFTAYALGELDEAERPEIERILADHPEIAREVEQVRLTARWLTERLQDEQRRETAALAAAPVAATPSLNLVGAEPTRKPRPWRRSLPLELAVACLFVGATAAFLLPMHYRSVRLQSSSRARSEPCTRAPRAFMIRASGAMPLPPTPQKK